MIEQESVQCDECITYSDQTIHQLNNELYYNPQDTDLYSHTSHGHTHQLSSPIYSTIADDVTTDAYCMISDTNEHKPSNEEVPRANIDISVYYSTINEEGAMENIV